MKKEDGRKIAFCVADKIMRSRVRRRRRCCFSGRRRRQRRQQQQRRRAKWRDDGGEGERERDRQHTAAAGSKRCVRRARLLGTACHVVGFSSKVAIFFGASNVTWL